MKVKDLIAFLEDCDPEAECLLGVQPSYPFECSITGVVVRDEYDDDFMDDVPEDDRSTRQPNLHDGRDGRKASDVIICQGSQLRYGKRDAWGV